MPADPLERIATSFEKLATSAVAVTTLVAKLDTLLEAAGGVDGIKAKLALLDKLAHPFGFGKKK